MAPEHVAEHALGPDGRSLDDLPEAAPPSVIELSDADSIDLEIGWVRKRIGASDVAMLAYNGSVPGPTLKVCEGSTLTVRATNGGPIETTVHWHGLRVRNRYDGTHETQAPIPIGGTFAYELEFPDPGVYWYHPHIREDFAQELGLYGNVLVAPNQPDYWPAADRELLLTLDDVLVEDGAIAPFSASETTHVAMGRFGNVMLVAGDPELELAVVCGEIVRLHMTNTANTRVFNVQLPGARMKLVGGDSGHVEREELVESFLIAPSERATVDVLFDRPGTLTLEHRTPGRTYRLAAITVDGTPGATNTAKRFDALRSNADLVDERRRIGPYLDAEPDRSLAFVAEMDMAAGGPATAFTCPMHPDVTSDLPERCPRCGMKLVPAHLVVPRQEPHSHGHGSHGDVSEGIEWEDDMVDVNRVTTRSNTAWKLVDRATGAENDAIDWRFRVGDEVKIRLVNEMDSDHPMPHPFHIHGAGRFLVLARDGEVQPNLVWKDTVLVRTGETVDILLQLTNPGIWMAHCHIAEHHEGGMMMTFRVDEPDA